MSGIEDHNDPSEEIHGHLARLLQVAVTAAAGLADQRAQRRLAAERMADQERAAARQQLEAEKELAHLRYRDVFRDGWWDRATPDQIAGTVRTALAWEQADPRAADAVHICEDQLQDRWDINLADIKATDPAHVQENLGGSISRVEEAQAAQAVKDRPAHAGRGSHQTRWEKELGEAAGPELSASITTANGWPALQRRLDRVHAEHGNVGATLKAALGRREINSASDKAATLVWRINHPGNQQQTKGRGPGVGPRGRTAEHTRQRQTAAASRQRGAGRD